MLLTFCYFLYFGTACSKLSDSSKFADDDEYIFPGLAKLVDNGDKTFTLSWEQVPAQDVTYLIFSRTSSRPYNFAAHDASVNELSWRTPDLSFEPNTCYIF